MSSDSRLRNALLPLASGVAAGVLSTWMLHAVLAETVLLDSSRPAGAESMLVVGLAFGIPAGAVMLALAMPRPAGSSGGEAEQSVRPEDP